MLGIEGGGPKRNLDLAGERTTMCKKNVILSPLQNFYFGGIRSLNSIETTNHQSTIIQLSFHAFVPLKVSTFFLHSGTNPSVSPETSPPASTSGMTCLDFEHMNVICGYLCMCVYIYVYIQHT